MWDHKMKNTLRGFVVLVVIITAAPYLSWAAAGPAGPFGFTWGAPPDKAPTPAIRRVELNSIDTSDYSGRDNSGRNCARKTIVEFGFSSANWKLSYRELGVSQDVLYQLGTNDAKFDRSMNGVVEAYIHKIEIVGKEMEVCAVYFENSLFQIHLDWDQYGPDHASLIKASLEKNTETEFLCAVPALSASQVGMMKLLGLILNTSQVASPVSTMFSLR
jgi:hypothetical protein